MEGPGLGDRAKQSIGVTVSLSLFWVFVVAVWDFPGFSRARLHSSCGAQVSQCSGSLLWSMALRMLGLQAGCGVLTWMQDCGS